tara:strand:+ start:1055 stop:1291 length:237 start_codon:yes stop_codon:yes gene_type:complete
MLKRIHINMHIIRSRKKKGTKEPPITVKTYKDNIYGNEIDIIGSSKVIYRPEKPLSCGATAWIETLGPVVIDGKKTLK